MTRALHHQRTPGNDDELAVASSLETIIGCARRREVEHCGPPSPDKGIRNVIRVELADHVRVDAGGLLRHFYTTSSCGVCGKASLDAVRVQIEDRETGSFLITADTLKRLPAALHERQTEFAHTGGLHARRIRWSGKHCGREELAGPMPWTIGGLLRCAGDWPDTAFF